MQLLDITPMPNGNGLCVGGQHLYRNRKDKKPYAYALILLTKNVSEYLYVKMPPSEALRKKAVVLKEKCRQSRYYMVEVSFVNLKIDKYIYQDKKTGEKKLKYNACASDFEIVED